ncbi:DUF6074 family protein [Rhizobium sp. YIM 134829]|uniref:DUF6074 family protein n=1 Tax=Rhizobium sp. YIM 134829 TaxID=3390453 RepID=UPI00397E5D32
MTAPHAETIVAFPFAGRRAAVRKAAAELEGVHGEEAVIHWRAACRAIARELRGLGCEEHDIHVQVMDFQAEVQLEMMRRYLDRRDDADAFAERNSL